jgi:hypothetical protein
MRRLDACLLSGVGVLAVHQLAYSASSLLGADSVVGHGHLATAWLLAGFAAVAGLTRSVTRSLRRRCSSVPSLGALSTSIAIGYAAMEAMERLIDGSSAPALFGEAVFWLGLAATPIVAVALRALTQSVQHFAQTLAARDEPRSWAPTALTVLGTTSIDLAPLLSRSGSVPRRGPPRRSTR